MSNICIHSLRFFLLLIALAGSMEAFNPAMPPLARNNMDMLEGDRLRMLKAPTQAGIALAKKGDFVNAFSLFKEACETNGDSDGCFGLGIMYSHAIGVDMDYLKAQNYFNRSCIGGNALACSNLASFYYDGKNGINEDKALAGELYMVGCQGGDSYACNNLAYMYANGISFAKDYFKALQYYKFACDLASPLGCYNLGLLTNTNNIFGLNKDKLGLIDLNYVACNQGDLIGCANLGYMYATGDYDAPVSYFNAGKYLRIACDGGILSSCNNLAALYESGAGTRLDFDRALELYGVACDKGLGVACRNYKILSIRLKQLGLDNRGAVMDNMGF